MSYGLCCLHLVQGELAAVISSNVTRRENASPSIMRVMALFSARTEVTKLLNLDAQPQV